MTDGEAETIQEQWRAATGYAGYEVSDQGNVQRCALYDSYGRLVMPAVLVSQHLSGSPQHHPTRYLEVSLRVGENRRRHVKVHHLVLTEYHGPRPDGLVGCHGPRGTLVNTVDNLRWDTQASNIQDMHNARGGHHNSLLETCLNGHDITNPDNVYENSAGRKCKKCQRWRATNRHRQNKGLDPLPVPPPD